MLNIVYVANEAYVSILAVSLYSLYKNHRDVEDLDVYLIQTGISKNSRDILTKMAFDFNRKLNIVNFEHIEEALGTEFVKRKFDISVMARLFVDVLLDEGITRVLYLDCDTLILKDLSKLFAVDLKNKLMAAAMEPTINTQVKLDIGMSPVWNYYNSGVLLIDLDKYRKFNIRDRILNYYESIKNTSNFSDQDAINGALVGQIMSISPSYNFFANYRYWKYKELVKLSRGYAVVPERSFDKARQNPHIIHFAGDDRPWYRFSLNYYKPLYREYKNKAPYIKSCFKEKSAIYLTCYHLMNLMTLYLPKLRRYISDQYIKAAGYPITFR